MSTSNSEHGLLCPTCKADLVMSDRQGIEIDYCPKCRGVWLDRGELDKIIERSQNTQPEQSKPYPVQESGNYGHQKTHHHEDHGKYEKRRKSSWLSDLFD